MSVRRLVAAWNRFFFTPRSPIPLGLFRILYGLLVIATLLLLHRDWMAWYGTHAWTSLSTMHKMEPGVRLNLFTIVPQSDCWAAGLFWVFLASAVCLTMGFLTRLSCVSVFLCLVSIQQRNVYILNPGDGFLRVAGFFLMFAPAGAAISIDRLVRIWKGKEGAEVPLAAPWAQRMIQFEMALVYFATFWWKSMGADWVNGTALYYVYHLDEFKRFPLPSWIMQPVIVKIGTWLTLAVEFSLGTLVWFKELCYPVLLFGVLLHLTLEYSLNIPLFQWVMLSSYLLFIEPEDLTRAWRWARDRMPGGAREPLLVLYDGESNQMSRIANVLRVVDVLGRLRVTDFQSATALCELAPQREDGMLVATGAGLRRGFDGFGIVARSVPILWLLAVPYVFIRRVEMR